MRFKGLDLNLLSAFDVLMQERNVSAAARRLNLTQPAASAALSRLRLFFDDEILVIRGKKMFPTAFAEGLIPQVRNMLASVETMLSNRSAFEPATAQRTFRIIASDYIITSFIAPLVERLSISAPGIILELAAPLGSGHTEIDEGKADLLISPDFFIEGEHPRELLFEENHVVVGWSENPLMHKPLSAEDYLAAGHVGVRIGIQRQPAFADRYMSVMGFRRRIEVETHSFLTIPPLIVGARRLALMQERLAYKMCERYSLRIQPIPVEFPLMKEMMQYHVSRGSDEGLIWLKDKLKKDAMSPVEI